MKDLIKRIKNGTTIYLAHSYQNPSLVRMFLVDMFGLVEITHAISTLVDFEMKDMFLIHPEDVSIEQTMDLIGQKCKLTIFFEDLG
jgi:hypothetical protein